MLNARLSLFNMWESAVNGAMYSIRTYESYRIVANV